MSKGKKLYRNTSNAIFAGVCSGVADYFDLDVSLIRILWAIITLAGGSGVIAYIVCAIIIPEKPDTPDVTEVDWEEIQNDI